MAQHILIAVALDHEDLVMKKLELARALLSDGGQITLLTVLESIPGFVAEFIDLKPENHLTQRTKAKLDSVAGVGADVLTEVVTGKPGVRIVQYAADHGVDLILVGSHSPAAQDYFLGSTAARVARRAQCSVYIVR